MQARIGIVKEGSQLIGAVSFDHGVRFRNRRNTLVFSLFRVGNKVNLVGIRVSIKENIHRERRERSAPAIDTNRVFERFVVFTEDDKVFRHGFVHPDHVVPPAQVGVNLQRLAVFKSSIGRPLRHSGLPVFVIGDQDIEVLNIRFLIGNQGLARLFRVFEHPDFLTGTRAGNVTLVLRKVRVVGGLSVPSALEHVVQRICRRTCKTEGHFLSFALGSRQIIVIKTGRRIQGGCRDWSGNVIHRNKDTSPVIRLLKMQRAFAGGNNILHSSENQTGTQNPLPHGDFRFFHHFSFHRSFSYQRHNKKTGLFEMPHTALKFILF